MSFLTPGSGHQLPHPFRALLLLTCTLHKLRSRKWATPVRAEFKGSRSELCPTEDAEVLPDIPVLPELFAVLNGVSLRLWQNLGDVGKQM